MFSQISVYVLVDSELQHQPADDKNDNCTIVEVLIMSCDVLENEYLNDTMQGACVDSGT